MTKQQEKILSNRNKITTIDEDSCLFVYNLILVRFFRFVVLKIFLRIRNHKNTLYYANIPTLIFIKNSLQAYFCCPIIPYEVSWCSLRLLWPHIRCQLFRWFSALSLLANSVSMIRCTICIDILYLIIYTYVYMLQCVYFNESLQSVCPCVTSLFW